VISDTTGLLRGLDSSTWLDGPLKWSAWAVPPELFLVVVTMLKPLRRVFGLCERLFLLTTNVRFILVALLVISRTTYSNADRGAPPPPLRRTSRESTVAQP
jgi:hypothetical protein